MPKDGISDERYFANFRDLATLLVEAIQIVSNSEVLGIIYATFENFRREYGYLTHAFGSIECGSPFSNYYRAHLSTMAVARENHDIPPPKRILCRSDLIESLQK